MYRKIFRSSKKTLITPDAIHLPIHSLHGNRHPRNAEFLLKHRRLGGKQRADFLTPDTLRSVLAYMLLPHPRHHPCLCQFALLPERPPPPIKL